jgi:predicted transcriptional regulator
MRKDPYIINDEIIELVKKQKYSRGSNMKGKRGRLELRKDILEYLIMNPGGAKPTLLMYEANLSHTQMKGYLGALLSEELMQEIPSKDPYSTKRLLRITQKGIDYYIKLRIAIDPEVTIK